MGWQMRSWNCVLYMRCPAWLRSDSAAPLCSWMSTCPSVTRARSAPVRQLVDICLLPPPSVVTAATASPLNPLPRTHPPSLPHHGHQTLLSFSFSLTPLSCPPFPRHQLWTTYAYPAVHLVLPCHICRQHASPSLSLSLWNCPSASLTQITAHSNLLTLTWWYVCTDMPNFACSQMRHTDRKIEMWIRPLLLLFVFLSCLCCRKWSLDIFLWTEMKFKFCLCDMVIFSFLF